MTESYHVNLTDLSFLEGGCRTLVVLEVQNGHLTSDEFFCGGQVDQGQCHTKRANLSNSEMFSNLHHHWFGLLDDQCDNIAKLISEFLFFF